MRKRVNSLFNELQYEDEEGADGGLTAVNLNVLPHLWIPDIEILDLMSFETHKVLSRLEGDCILILR